MVKTRRSAGVRLVEDSPGDDGLLALNKRRTRAQPLEVSEINGYASDECDESLPRERRSRNRVIVETDSADDTSPPRKTRGTTSHSQLYSHGETESDDGEHDRSAGDAQLPSHGTRRQIRARIQAMKGESILDEDDGNKRRSTRKRRLLYGTFDQKLIDQHIGIIRDGEYSEEDSRERSRSRSKRNRESSGEHHSDEKVIDMYSRVKRPRRQVKRDMYGLAIHDEDERGTRVDQSQSSDQETGETEESTSTEDEEEEKQEGRSYFLREHRQRVNLYEAASFDTIKRPEKPKSVFARDSPPRVRQRVEKVVYRSPARRTPKFRKRRAAFHGSSSTSSSSSDGASSDDERKFERRKSKSMAKSRNRCLPMNLTSDDVAGGIVRDRVKVGSSLADVDPMSVDRSINFESVGGLGKHIRSLKEMIIFPLLYPEVFDRFKITPPRGVLFYGPPGTGKTLVARALANECSQGDRKVAFFMRKGADCLSKWVGESERQLRLLFDQAYQMRPSIIFFDEIDGLAPVRSSRQDQIHSSIVSTLLALMDGLDNRGEIVVIGATNRIDSIDPALRRPGRFDREFLFPLPSVEARRQILQIHTKQWNPQPVERFLTELAERCVGYCGADLKALCTEACLHALRRRYPQIYDTSDKLQLDVASIEISAKDFTRGMQNIVPTSQRSMTSPGRSLTIAIKPLLQAQLDKVISLVQSIFPPAQLNSLPTNDSGNSNNGSSGDQEPDLYSDDEDNGPSIYDQTGRSKKRLVYQGGDNGPKSYLTYSSCASDRPWMHRPKLLLSGRSNQGQSSHLAPAVLHVMERMPVHTLDLPSLYAVSAKTPEESCSQVFREARRTSPSIIYIPHIGQLWDVIGDTLRATFQTLLLDIQPGCPVLILATSELPAVNLPDQVRTMFEYGSGEICIMRNPNADERRACFYDLLLNQAIKPPPCRKQAARRILEELPKAAPLEPRKMTDKELKKLHEQEEQTLRELRIFLRDVLNKLGRDRKFAIFTKPVDVEEVEDYYDIIKNPMDLSTMMSKIDLHKYQTVKEFLSDIDLICSNCLEYNPDRNPGDRALRHRACALRDTAYAIISAELDKDFEKLCQEIADSRARRGESASVAAPDYYFTKPVTRQHSLDVTAGQPDHQENYPSRFSRRTRGMQVETDSNNSGRTRETQETVTGNSQNEEKIIIRKIRIKSNRDRVKKLSPWCRPKCVKRKVVIRIDKDGNEIWPDWYNNLMNKIRTKATMKSDKEDDITVEESEKENRNKDDEIQDQNDTSEHSDIDEEVSPTFTARSGRNSQEDPNYRLRSPVTDTLQVKLTRSARSRSRSPRISKPVVKQEEETDNVEVNSEPDEEGYIHVNGDVSIRGTPRKDSPRTETVKSNVGRELSPKRSPRSRCGASSPDRGPGAVDRPPSPHSSHNSPQKDQMEVDETNPKVIQNKDNCPDITTKEEEEVTSTKRVLRPRSKTTQMVRAAQILQEEAQPVVIDRDRLLHVLEKTVCETEGFPVEKIEKLYSLLNQCIHSHRLNHDRTEMIHDMETVLSKCSKMR